MCVTTFSTSRPVKFMKVHALLLRSTRHKTYLEIFSRSSCSKAQQESASSERTYMWNMSRQNIKRQKIKRGKRVPNPRVTGRTSVTMLTPQSGLNPIVWQIHRKNHYSSLTPISLCFQTGCETHGTLFIKC